jgi:CRISPR-associated endonuclease/helicase Cas3
LGKPLPPERIEAPAAVLVTGLVILADWLVSQETYLRDRQRQLGPLEEHFGRSMRDAEGLAKRAGLLPVELERKDFHEAYGIDGAPNPLQSSIAEELPAAVSSGSRKGGILLVTAAPGDGKSEAALEAERVMSAAFGTRGFAFLLPTMATSDKMHERVAGVLSRQAGRGAGLTLTHSMAWLSRAYADEDLEVGERVLVGEEHQSPVERQLAEMRPRWWLRGPKRPLLAQYAVGTIDQALMAVLPVRHNALRMLALSGKTFIVDEAHAYDPYMQVLLGRLLTWLGAYGVPVVLLSATLPASVSDKLIREYLSGAGHRDDEGRSFTCPYPGWLYVDGETGKCTGISPQRHEEQADERPITLQVDVRPVTRKVGGHTGGARPADDRLAVIADVLEPLAADKGTALVVCNTVAEAQATYTWLKTRFGSHLAEDDLMLLHARFPGEERERRTEIVVSGMGRQGVRPARRVIVATQVVEQSLDLDADVVISDLAPMALLLQRAGRCWRHEAYWSRQGRPEDRERPPWAVKSGPRLVVLDPIAGGGKVPVEWGEVYPEFLLSTTSHLLTEREGRPVAVPQDVQELVEAVHGERTDRYNWESPAMSEQWAAYAGKTAAERSVGRSLVIPSARKVTGLNGLHHQKGTEDEWQAATRLGVDSVRLLCVYDHGEDNLTFDAEGEQPLPKPDVKRRLAVADVRTIMSRTIPVSAGWFREEHEHHQPPDEWAEHPMLGDLLVLTQPVRNGRPQPVTVRGKQLRLDAELGLVRE